MRVLAAVLLASVALPLGVAWADDVRPASLDIREVSPGVFDVRWKTPMRGRSRLRAYPQLPREALVVEGSRTGEAGHAA